MLDCTNKKESNMEEVLDLQAEISGYSNIHLFIYDRKVFASGG
jgi:hypothetical protein